MLEKLSVFLDDASEYFAHRKGLLPLLGIFFVILDFFFQIFPVGWVSASSLFLHIGIILAIIGFMFAWAL
jgi:hypothetical protein